MRLLVLHQNFPGQFGHLVKAWSQRPGWDVRALGRDTAPGLPGFNGLTRYRLARHPHAQQHPYLRSIESAVLHGQQVARVLLDMKRQGFTPDTILAHPGWGESLYVKDVFPDVRLVHYCEWYYNPEGADLGFDPEFPITFDDRARVRSWNALHALNMTNCDPAVTPTHSQKSRHPEVFHPKITVQHEGIDTEGLGPDPNATKDAKNWREKMLREVKLDATRTHFLGRVPRQQNINVLQVSAAYVYLIYPFVLSWSLLEAMHCGAPVLGSDTAPVQEVIRGEENGVLSTYFDLVKTSDRIDWAFAAWRADTCHETPRATTGRLTLAGKQPIGLPGNRCVDAPWRS
jgi:Glycosyl transferase family 4 group/Glycosyl transferases group 1